MDGESSQVNATADWISSALAYQYLSIASSLRWNAGRLPRPRHSALVALRGNPLKDIREVRNPVGVMIDAPQGTFWPASDSVYFNSSSC